MSNYSFNKLIKTIKDNIDTIICEQKVIFFNDKCVIKNINQQTYNYKVI
jgi:hypothetical protein